MEQMTLEQAIQEIQTYMYSDCYIDAPSNDACKLAISALEKQVPKKAIKKTNDISGIKTYFCPGCGVHIYLEEKYCAQCGITIDWSE